MTPKTRTVAQGHRVSVRGIPAPTGKWIQDAYVQLQAGDAVTITPYVETPPPPPPPVDPPPPTGTRPFPAPTTTRTVQVPSSIDATGAADAFPALQAFVDSVPDGSVIEFPVAGIYRMAKGLGLGRRNHLVFQLRGSEFRQTGPNEHISSIFVPGYKHGFGFTGASANLAFHGGVVTGFDPNPGAGQPLRGENRHAIRANGSRFIEASGMTVRAVTGDHVYLDNVDDSWVHGNTIETAGRNGWSLIKGYRHLVEDNTYRDCGYATFDIEPNFQNEPSGDVMIRRNAAGGPGIAAPWQSGIGLVSVDGAGTGASIARVTIADITSSVAPQVYIDNKAATTRMRDVTVINVRGPAGGTIRIIDVDGVLVYGNSAPLTLTGCTGIRTSP
jgi:hypothetical protein